MRLAIYRATWGLLKQCDGYAARSPVPDLKNALPALKRLGYEGIEAPLKLALLIGSTEFKRMVDDYDLKVIFQIFTDGPVAPGHGGLWGTYEGHPEPGPGAEQHLEVFKAQVEAAYAMDPTFVNSHSGNDFWSESEANKFFSEALQFQKDGGFTVHHECHRKRYMHSPWVTRALLPKQVDLTMVADLSHWLCVAETDTSDPELNKVITTAAARVHHIHGRVGFDHGPQVCDPRAPLWLPYTEGHEHWWDTIWKEQVARGQEVTTFTPEHGPPNYQACDPHTGMPTADIFDINHWIALRAAERFAQYYGKENTSSVRDLPDRGLTF